MTDVVNNPSHYAQEGEVECIDYMEQRLSRPEFIGYLNGNVIKYVHRWRYKNGVEDLRKARWYLNRLIKMEVEVQDDSIDDLIELLNSAVPDGFEAGEAAREAGHVHHMERRLL